MKDSDRSASAFVRSIGVTRRNALATGVAGLATALAITSQRHVSGQAGTPVETAGATPTDKDDSLLFVQSYATCTLTPGSDEGLFSLVLKQGTGQTFFFSDRPNRLVGTIDTGAFIDLFRKETAGDPANAALLVQASQPEKSKRPVEVTYIVELMDMQYDAATATSTFTIKLLADPASLDMHFLKDPQKDLTGPVTYGASQMFIDAGGLMQLIAYGAQD